VPTNLLILPLLAGFWFIHFCHYFRFRAQRLDGYRLLIESSLAGAILFLFGRAITYCVVSFTPLGPSISKWWNGFAPLSFSGAATLAFFIGLASPFAVNRLWGEDESKKRAVERHGNDLLRLFDNALRESQLVSITLDNRKVYVGYIVTAPNLRTEDAYIALLPMISGYRDAGTLEIKFISLYDELYANEEMDANRFRVAVPVASIKMASLFDPEIYAKFADHREKRNDD
jgi:hypothetical protein